jgi:hypothetical protein
VTTDDEVTKLVDAYEAGQVAGRRFEVRADDNIRARNPGYRTAGVNRRSKVEAAIGRSKARDWGGITRT